MAKNTAGLIAGIILTIAGILGAGFTLVGFSEEWGLIIPLIYSLIALGLGIYLLFNYNKEDSIEQIKTRKAK